MNNLLVVSWQHWKRACFSKFTNNPSPSYSTLKARLDYDCPAPGPTILPIPSFSVPCCLLEMLGEQNRQKDCGQSAPYKVCVWGGGSEPPCSGFLISKEHPHSLAVHTVHRDRQSPPHCKPMSKKEVSIHTWEMWAYHGGGALSKWEFWVDENERTAIMLSSTLLSQRWGRGRGVHSFSPVSLQIILVNKIREALISKFS